MGKSFAFIGSKGDMTRAQWANRRMALCKVREVYISSLQGHVDNCKELAYKDKCVGKSLQDFKYWYDVVQFIFHID
jgi:hypothetical protein